MILDRHQLGYTTALYSKKVVKALKKLGYKDKSSEIYKRNSNLNLLYINITSYRGEFWFTRNIDAPFDRRMVRLTKKGNFKYVKER